MLDSILQLDVKTLMVVLFWGNLVSGLLILTYHCTGARDVGAGLLHFLPAKLFQAFAYLFLMSRGQISDLVSVHLGNTFLMIGFYLEALTIMALIQEFRAGLFPLTAILIAGVVSFNAVELFSRNPSLRVAYASVCVFLIFLIPNLRLLVSRNTTRFKQFVGLFYLAFLAVLLPRAFYAVTRDMDILTNSAIQALTFMSLVLLMIFSFSAFLLLMKDQAYKAVNMMATTDYLTGLYNRYRFLEAAGRAFERCRFNGASVALLFFDIDHFKDVNDTYGHGFGDAVLMDLGRMVRESVRPTDLCCRYGGEEFVIFLPDADVAAAMKIAERLRQTIAEAKFDEHPEFTFTISVGVVDGVPRPEDSLELYVGQADAAMYSAKKTGRDRVVAYDSLFGCPDAVKRTGS